MIATGAQARKLRSPCRGRHTLRTVADAAVLRESFARDRGSRSSARFIGAEVASTAQALGVEVTLVDMARVPLERVLGGRWASSSPPASGSRGSTCASASASRSSWPGSTAVSRGWSHGRQQGHLRRGARRRRRRAGGRPRGRTRRDPDRRLRPHRAPRRLRVRRRRVRLATVRISPRARRALDVGGRPGASVAQAILGRERPYDDLPYFWSDQFGLRLQHVGHAEAWAAVELDGNDESFTARYVDHGGQPLAVLLANRPREVSVARRELTAAALAEAA